MQRIDFLRLLGRLALPGLAPADPRLTARPRAPFRPVDPGATSIAPARERGGLLYVPTAHGEGSPLPLIVSVLPSHEASATNVPLT